MPGIGTPKLTVGLISGGINTNVVPDRIAMRLDRRLIPEENGREVERKLIALIKGAAARRKGISVECRRILLAEPLKPAPGIERLVEPLLRNARRALKTRIAVKGVPLFTDARHYSARGIPTVLYGAGPRSLLEANVHRADEHVRLTRPQGSDARHRRNAAGDAVAHPDPPRAGGGGEDRSLSTPPASGGGEGRG